MQTILTSKGQVTIPREVRQHFGLIQSRRTGMPADFDVASFVTDVP